MKHTLIMMAGPASSGKSVLAKIIKDSHDDCVVVSYKQMAKAALVAKEPQHYVDKRYIEVLNNMLETHEYVIADNYNINANERKKIFDNINIDKYNIICVWVETPLNVALKRHAQLDEKWRRSEDSIKQMYKIKVSPQEQEPFKKVIFISEQMNYAIGTDTMEIQNILDTLKAL